MTHREKWEDYVLVPEVECCDLPHETWYWVKNAKFPMGGFFRYEDGREVWQCDDKYYTHGVKYGMKTFHEAATAAVVIGVVK